MGKALFVLPDLPGYFHRLAYLMADRLKARGADVVFAIPSPYYPKFKAVDFSTLGPVEVLSSFRSANRDPPEGFDYWATYSTFARRDAFTGAKGLRWSDFWDAAHFFTELFDRHGPFAVVWGENVSNAFLSLAAQESQKRGIPFYGYISARVPGAFNITVDCLGASLLENPRPNGLSATGPADYMGNPQNDLSRYSIAASLGTLLRMLARGLFLRPIASLEVGNPLRHQIHSHTRLMRRKLTHFWISQMARVFSLDPQLDDGKINVLYPLQYRPEASTAVMARHYGDEREIIRNLAFSLLPTAKLIVKEHPSALGIRPPSFYRDIARFPGVRLLDPSYPLSKAFPKLDALVTLTSTAGFEALQAGVPVLVLGEVFYQRYPGAQSIRSFAELETAVRGIKKRFPQEVPSSLKEEIVRRYVKSCFAGSFNYIDPRCLEGANVEALIGPLADRLIV